MNMSYDKKADYDKITELAVSKLLEGIEDEVIGMLIKATKPSVVYVGDLEYHLFRSSIGKQISLRNGGQRNEHMHISLNLDPTTVQQEPWVRLEIVKVKSNYSYMHVA